MKKRGEIRISIVVIIIITLFIFILKTSEVISQSSRENNLIINQTNRKNQELNVMPLQKNKSRIRLRGC